MTAATQNKMSWGATGFTPIVTYNQPPFGFHEVLTPTDYPRCNQDPYIGTEQLKEDLNRRFSELERIRNQRRQIELSRACNVGAVEAFDSGMTSSSFLWKAVLFVSIAYILCKALKKTD